MIFDSVFNEDRTLGRSSRDNELAVENYAYPPRVGSGIYALDAPVSGDAFFDRITLSKKLGTLTSCYEGFEDSAGLALLKRSSIEKARVGKGTDDREDLNLDGVTVWAGGSIGVLKKLENADTRQYIDLVEDEGDSDDEDDADAIAQAEKEAAAAAARLEKLKARAAAAMARRKAKK